MSPNQRTEFPPPWLPVIVNLLIALILLGSFLTLYVWGNVLAWQGKGTPDWPTKSEILETMITAMGGIMAAVFSVALNLSASRRPTTFRELVQRIVNVLTIIAPPEAAAEPWVVAEILERLRGGPPALAILARPRETWLTLNDRALTVVAVILTLAYLFLVPASAVSAIFFVKTAPTFICAFGKVGIGVLVGAFAAWVGGIPKR